MHPILRSPKLLAAYLFLWQVLAVMLAALLHGSGPVSWKEALLLGFPLCLLQAFLCLAPWYTCRQTPLASARVARIVGYHFSAAVLATSLWIALARAIGSAINLENRLKPSIPQLISLGLLMYMLSVALHYVVLAVEASR